MDLDDREWNDPLNTSQTQQIRDRIRLAHAHLYELEPELTQAMNNQTGFAYNHLRMALFGIQKARHMLEGRTR